MKQRILFFIGLVIVVVILAVEYFDPDDLANVDPLPIDPGDSAASYAAQDPRNGQDVASTPPEEVSAESEEFSSVSDKGAYELTVSPSYPQSYADSTRLPTASERQGTGYSPDQEESGASRSVPRHWSVVDRAGGAILVVESDFDVIRDGFASASLSLSGASNAGQFGGIAQVVEAGKVANQRLRFSGYLKRQDLEGTPVFGALWIRADDQFGKVVAFENSQGRYLPSDEIWSESTIIIDIPTSAENLFFGATIVGNGTVWVDELSLAVVDETFPLTAPLYDAQGTNPVPREVLDRPMNLSFEDVVPLADE